MENIGRGQGAVVKGYSKKMFGVPEGEDYGCGAEKISESIMSEK